MVNKIIDIEHICTLATLHLTEEEKKELVPQLEKIVEWVKQIAELDLSQIEENSYPAIDFPAPFRSDTVQPSLTVKEALINAPERGRDFFKVPKVIEGKE